MIYVYGVFIFSAILLTLLYIKVIHYFVVCIVYILIYIILYTISLYTGHAKAIFKERERLTSILAFDRLAVPPTSGYGYGQGQGVFERQQLEMWNNWIRYERECVWHRCICI